jgi:hypothetical protein
MTERKKLTTAQRLSWAVSFANEDLAGLREGDWLNLRDDVGRFLGFDTELLLDSAPAFVPVPREQPRDVSDTDIKNLQLETRALLQAGAGLDVPRGPGMQVRTGSTKRVSTEIKCALHRLGGDRLVVQASGGLRDVFLTAVVFLMVGGGPSNLRRCPAPECERLFWKSGRRKYCSQQCTNRAVFRAWSQTEKGKTRSKREVGAAKQRRQYRRKLAEMRSRKEGGAR